MRPIRHSKISTSYYSSRGLLREPRQSMLYINHSSLPYCFCWCTCSLYVIQQKIIMLRLFYESNGFQFLHADILSELHLLTIYAYFTYCTC